MTSHSISIAQKILGISTRHTGPEAYKHKKPLPEGIGNSVIPLFQRLSDRNLLEKCADGYTQNQN